MHVKNPEIQTEILHKAYLSSWFSYEQIRLQTDTSYMEVMDIDPQETYI